MIYEEIKGDLIKLALTGEFDVISHGCNCFCNMGAGIAPQMAEAFGANKFTMEDIAYFGDRDKLGTIDFKRVKDVWVVNSYTQFGFGRNHTGGEKKPLDYVALRDCMRAINEEFDGHHIGLPMIGCGLAGGDWERVKKIIQKELKDMKVTIVMYDGGEKEEKH